MAERYNLKNIQDLLSNGFTNEELLSFCLTEPAFSSLYHNVLSDEKKTKPQIIRLILAYGQRNGVLEVVLSWAGKANPARFEQHKPYLIDDRTTATNGENGSSTPPPEIVEQGGSKKSLKWLRNPVWQMIGVLVAIIGVVWFFSTPPIITPQNPTIASKTAATAAAGSPTDAPTFTPTPTATPRPTPPDTLINTPALPMQSNSQISDISAELIEFSRFANTITAKVRLINSDVEIKYLSFPYYYENYLLNEATKDQYELIDQSNKGQISVPGQDSLEIWKKFDFSSELTVKNVTLVLGNGILFQHVEVP